MNWKKVAFSATASLCLYSQMLVAQTETTEDKESAAPAVPAPPHSGDRSLNSGCAHDQRQGFAW